MIETTEEIYERYLKECDNHINWLKDCHSTLYKRLLLYFGSNHLHYNARWINALITIEIILGLTEEEKRSHKLEDYV